MSNPPTRYLIIHAHFYQPPRENPWLGVVEREPSAAPYHDWNERILRECYRPNSASRILDERGRVLKIASNYRHISFNFGPTLMQWLVERDPELFERIVQADHESVERNGGHGNAIAQAYNHMILPLANERDIQTQIRWGIADFRHRFGREPEAMWLPETAVNRKVLRALVEHGMKYVILSPYQAKRIRRLDGRSRWADASGGKIDTSRPYRWRPSENDAAGIDVLFYHGELSRRVSFEDLLTNAGRFAEAILAAYSGAAKRDQLVLIATDGETYGHHKPFGDMALSYLLEMELPKTGVVVANPASFLARHRPEWEVEIDEGPDGLGSSWSCAHGVGRWYRDCGCSTGGEPGWHQMWRGPLRQALDLVRDRLAEVFEREGGRIFRDPWAARDAYIEILLQRDEDTIESFFREHAPGATEPETRVLALKLLEMQRHAMLMYTSCGWFFADISGLESQQILRYAARALELARDFGETNLEEEFLRTLERAPSNRPEIGNGRRVFEKLVRPSAFGIQAAVHLYAVTSLVQGELQPRRVFRFAIEREEVESRKSGEQTLLYGSVSVREETTGETRRAWFAELHRGGIDFRGRVLLDLAQHEWEEKRRRLAELGERADSGEGDLVDVMGGPTLRLIDLPTDERERLINELLRPGLLRIEEMQMRAFEENEALVEDLGECGYTLPRALATAAAVALSRRIVRELERALPGLEPPAVEKVVYWKEFAERVGVEIDPEEARAALAAALDGYTKEVAASWRTGPCLRIVRGIELSRRLGLQLDETPLQDWYWIVVLPKLEEVVERVVGAGSARAGYVLAAALLRLGTILNFNLDRFKERLRPIEEQLSQDPSYWP